MSDIESKMLRQGLIKVPISENKAKDSPYKRVAKFLFIIGTEQAAEVLKQLSKEQIDKVVAELVTIRTVGKDEALEVLAEFNEIYSKSKNSIGGIETAKTMLTNAFGSEKAEKILENTVPVKMPIPFEYLEGIDNEVLSRVLEEELPATKSIVLSQLKPKQAACYINSLPEEEKKDIVIRLAKMEKIDSAILQQISEVLKSKVVDINLTKHNSIDGVSVLAEILRKIDYDSSNSILNSLKISDEVLADSIKNKLLTLNDIANIHPKHIQYLISPMNDTELAVLIHAKEEKFRTAILKNVSKNRASSILEEEKYLQPISKKELKQAVGNFLAKAKTEIEKGKIILIKDEADKLIF